MAWDFDGSTQYGYQPNPGLLPVDSYKGMAMIDVSIDDTTAAGNVCSMSTTGANAFVTPFVTTVSSLSRFALTLKTNASANIVVAYHATTGSDAYTLEAGKRYRVWWTWDTEATSSVQLFVNGEDWTSQITYSVNSTGLVGWSGIQQITMGCYYFSGAPGGLFNGKIYAIGVWPGGRIDLTAAKNNDDLPALADLVLAKAQGAITDVGYGVLEQQAGVAAWLLFDGAAGLNHGYGPDIPMPVHPTRLMGADNSTADEQDDRKSAQAWLGETWDQCAWCGWFFPKSQLRMQRGKLACTTGPRDYDQTNSTKRNRGGGVYF